MLTWDNTKDYKTPKSKKDSDGIKKWCLEYKINYIYQGRTANPPKEVLKEAENKSLYIEEYAREMIKQEEMHGIEIKKMLRTLLQQLIWHYYHNLQKHLNQSYQTLNYMLIQLLLHYQKYLPRALKV